MYKTTEQRIRDLEQLVEKQAFHLQLLHDLVRNEAQHTVYHDILASNMSEHSYKRLQQLTHHYERKLENGEIVTLSHFLYEFKRILGDDSTTTFVADIATLVPRWLGSVGNGFSPALYTEFYSK